MTVVKKYNYQHDYSRTHPEPMYDRVMREQKAKKIIAVLKDFYQVDTRSLSCLDMSCSTGWITNYLKASFGSVIGMNIDKDAVIFGATNPPGPIRAGIHDRSVQFVVGDSMNVMLKDSSVDVAVCTHMYEHVPDSERLLKLLQKGITVEQVRNAVRICRKYRLRVFSNFMINLPTETEEDVAKTLVLADEIKSDISIFNVTCPFPGTELHSYLKHKLTYDDYTKMSSYVSYNTYIDLIESKCKLSAHNIPINDLLARIQVTVPVPRNIRLKFNLKYMRNFIRYFILLPI